ncbi:MAG: hypothetical protein IKD06_00140 [Clostridia bacterium]|nr:hypothetical protein [Clostridia bacterium]
MKKLGKCCLQIITVYAVSMLILLCIGLIGGQFTSGLLLTVPVRCICFAIVYALAGLMEGKRVHRAVSAVLRWLLRAAAMYAAFYAWRGLAAGDSFILMLLIVYTVVFWWHWVWRLKHPLPPVNLLEAPKPHPVRNAFYWVFGLFSLASAVLSIMAATDIYNATGISTQWLLRFLLLSAAAVGAFQLFRIRKPVWMGLAVFFLLGGALALAIFAGTDLKNATAVALWLCVGYAVLFWAGFALWRVLAHRREEWLRERGPYHSLYNHLENSEEK